jgi:hypothetical protein
MKKIILVFMLVTLVGCKSNQLQNSSSQNNVNATITAWHRAAAAANYDDYFNLMTEDAIFIGTDANENWNKKAFQIYAKPHFDKGKAWNFKTLERHVYFDKTGKTAWFDELLDTQMKICRGSGILVKENKQWKIKHYVLSMTVPNENSAEVIKIKMAIEDALIKKLQKKD